MTTALGPDIDEAWIAKFAAGLDADQREYGVSLMGGDTVATPGPTTLSLTALGLVPTGRALRRRGAKPGDRLFVSGTIGDGILGLKVLKGELFDLSANQRDALADRYHLPQPRLALGASLLAGGKVTAAMDVSDGLVADAGHIGEASRCGLVIRADRVPLSAGAQEALANDLDLLPVLLSGGDDYELLFTAGAAFTAPASVTEIGEVISGSGVTVLDRDGAEIPLKAGGWQHF
jgi:thiamine-monophosphate kinase